MTLTDIYSRSESAIVSAHLAKVPVDLGALADALGLPVSYEKSIGPSIAGMLKRDPISPSGFKIIVNANDAPRRQRFTVAHEIAHYILHRDLIEEGVVDDALYRSKLSDDLERQADRFAAQLLLPANAVKKSYKETKALGPLADKFQVSDAALRIRLKELGLAA